MSTEPRAVAAESDADGSAILTLDQLLAAADASVAEAADNDRYTLPGVGTFRVRPLNREEAIKVAQTSDGVQKEAMILSWGVVEPRMTHAQVLSLMKRSRALMLEPLSREIGRRSGLLEDADKAAYKSDGGESDAGV